MANTLALTIDVIVKNSKALDTTADKIERLDKKETLLWQI